MDPKQNKALIILTILAGAAVRLAYLGAAPFWYDEAFTASVVRLPFMRMLAAVAGDTHPPLYYLLLWVWGHIGGYSEIWMRLPSAIYGILSLVLAWWILVKMDQEDLVPLVMVFMAFSPWQIHFSQEARMYTLLEVLVLGAWLAILYRQWLLYTALAILILYTHNYGLAYVVCLFMLAFLGEALRPVHSDPLDTKEEEKVLEVWLANAVAIAAYIPWAVVLVIQMRTISGGYWIRPITGGFILDVMLKQFLGFEVWQPVGVMAALLVLMGVMLAVYRMITVKMLGKIRWLIMGLGPLAIALAASVAWRPVLLHRGLIGSDLALYTIVALPFYKQTRPVKLMLACLVVPVLLSGILVYHDQVTGAKEAGLDLLAYVQDHWQPGDILVHGNDSTALVSNWYGSNLTQLELDNCQANGGLSDQTREAIGITRINSHELLTYPRVWVMWSDAPTINECERAAMLDLLTMDPEYLSVDDEFTKAGVWLMGSNYARP